MKKPVSLLVLIGLLVNCTYTPKYYAQYERGDVTTISSRVGDVVDVQERDKYALFHGIEGFESARFYEIRGGGYEVEIVTTSGVYIATNRDSLAVLVLRDYINRYEEVIENRENFEIRWQIVDYDTLGQPIRRHELNKGRGQISMMFGVGCCLGGGLAAGIVGYVPSYSSTSGTPMIIATIAGALLSGAAGFLLGARLSGRAALKWIKAAREPKLVSHQ